MVLAGHYSSVVNQTGGVKLFLVFFTADEQSDKNTKEHYNIRLVNNTLVSSSFSNIVALCDFTCIHLDLCSLNLVPM